MNIIENLINISLSWTMEAPEMAALVQTIFQPVEVMG
jgi:hypothetical protein